ncbi:hypothetical protein [Aquibacillus saliphilus]|uniref:hypothetical protein n=1 Tax=Aquibacillus saliphilus TaxID=1909422 RepID=UPI001CF06BDC|nr:hypothetical protein [Aquibacillus saliphilus]
MYLVSSCFNWIGFHLTQRLLNDSKEVIGLDQIATEREENLSLFIGRNSLLTHVTDKYSLINEFKSERFKTVFDVADDEEFVTKGELNADQWIRLSSDPTVANFEDTLTICLPLLYGKWMPRDKNGFYYLKNYIEFNSARFEKDAVHIDDFIDALWKVPASRGKTEVIKCQPIEWNKTKENNQTNILYIEEQEKKENRLKTLNKHYQQFCDFY